MNHPKCETCEHFDPLVDEWDNPPGFGQCGLVAMTCDMIDWKDEMDGTKLLPEFSEHLAGVMDGSSYKATLHPHPNFYCPMHSELMPQLITR